MAGVTVTGFELLTLQEILAQIEADQLANISPLLDVSADSPLGQLNGIIARQAAIIWEQIQAVYKSNDPDAAEGDALTSIAKLTGTERRAASFSTVTIDVDLDTGTELIAGTHFVSIDGRPDVRFTPIAGVIRDAPGGAVSLPFRAENSGPVQAPAHTLTVIATPVVGWNSADNALDAVVGRPSDDDPTLRARRETELTAAGSSTTFAIAADIDKLTGVISTKVFENTENITDSRGIPPHSFEVLVWDGATPAADDDEIAQAIWDVKPAGIRAFGTTDSGTAHDRNPLTLLADGDAHTVEFSRPTEKLIYLEYDLTTDGTYVGDTTFKQNTAAIANQLFPAVDGFTLYASKLAAIAFTQQGVLSVVSLKLGFSASPTGTSDLTINLRERASFDSTRITVT